MTQPFTVFVYSWYTDDDEALHAFALDSNNQTVHLQIDHFTPYVYVELPSEVVWSDSRKQSVIEVLRKLPPSRKNDKEIHVQPVLLSVLEKKKLYNANVVKNEEGVYEHITYPFIFASFSSRESLREFCRKLSYGVYIPALSKKYKLKTHEDKASDMLQLTTCRRIPVTGWITGKGRERVGDKKHSSCHREFLVDWNKLDACTDPAILRTVPAPRVMMFDCEANSSNINTMPKNRPDDKIFQISLAVTVQGSNHVDKYLLSLGQPEQKVVGEDVNVYSYETEGDLLCGFAECIEEIDPQIIGGYNILGWDFSYLIQRGKLLGVFNELASFGYLPVTAKRREIQWSSTAFSKQFFIFLDAPGRLLIDMLPIIKRDFKFPTYRLDYVANEIIKQRKDPLSVKGIFKCYRMFSPASLALVGKYCLAPGTRVATSSGSVRIEDLHGSVFEAWSWDEEKGGMVLSPIKYNMANGEKECVEVTFSDGTTVQSTGDHRFYTTEGWVEAKDLNSTTQVWFAPEPALYDYQTEKDLKFDFGGLVGELCYEKASILARLIGYLITDGALNQGHGCIDFGTRFDAEQARNDVVKLWGKSNKIYRAQYTYRLGLPIELRRKLLTLKGMPLGSKISSADGLPIFVTDTKTPVWIVREFLKGLMGGDGWSPGLTKDEKFTAVGFSQSKVEGQLPALQKTMEQLIGLFGKFNLHPSIRKSKKNGFGKGHTIELCFSKDETVLFYERIGYAYCYSKSYRLAIAVSYYRRKEKCRQQFEQVCFRTRELMFQGKVSSEAREIACTELQASQPIYAPASLPSSEVARKFRGQVKVFNTKQGTFPKPSEYLKEVGAYEYFTSQTSSKSHVLKQEAKVAPGFFLTVLQVKKIGVRPTYDIEVADTHSFLANGAVAHNCVIDSLITLQLFEKLKTWVSSCQMSATWRVTILDLYTQGQQLKIYSQVYWDCLEKNFVVQNDGYICAENESYTGAIVLEPEAGIYDDIVILDFASLYPSVMISHNICYSTLVLDPKIPDEDCHIFEWEDHVGCPHDTVKHKTKVKKVLCCKRYYRFLKEPKGVIPTLLINLLAERKKANNELKKLKAELENKEMDSEKRKGVELAASILDALQTALKLSSNSMYGGYGVRKGKLPFMPGAMCTTAGGRRELMKAKETVEKNYPCKIIYGDTDSLFIQFEEAKKFMKEGKMDHSQLSAFALEVAALVSKPLPPPMKLEWEVTAKKMLILTKKRYICELTNNKTKIRGIMVARRDNAPACRDVFNKLLERVLARQTQEQITNFLVDSLNLLCAYGYSTKEYVITKSIKDVEDYKVKLPDEDPVKRKKQFLNKGLDMNYNTDRDYLIRSLPAQVQLAERMRKRGMLVEAGSRLEYVITTVGGLKAKVWQKIEDIGYYRDHSDVIRLDMVYYAKSLVNPVDQVLEVVFELKKFMRTQLDYRTQKRMFLNELLKVTRREIVLL